MTGPKFDDGSGYGRRSCFQMVAGIACVILAGIFLLGMLMADRDGPDDATNPAPAVLFFAALGGLLLYSANKLASNGKTTLKPIDPNRVVKTNHDNTDTNGRGQDYYANLKDWEIQQCEDTRVEMYEAEMRQHGEGN